MAQQTANPPATRAPAGTGVKSAQIAAPSNPVIRVFTVSPERLGYREHLVFRWQVEPSPTGSPAAEVKVVAGAIALHTATVATGTYTFRAREWMYRSIFPPEMHGRASFSLVAKTTAGVTAPREVETEVLSLLPVIDRFWTQPASPIRIGETIIVNWRVSRGMASIPIRSVLVEEMAEDGRGDTSSILARRTPARPQSRPGPAHCRVCSGCGPPPPTRKD